MRICFHAPDTPPEPWVRRLRASLPEAEVEAWQPGHAVGRFDYAVVWSPPQALADEQPGLRAVFNLGAGVDALLPVRWPAGTLLVRLDDAGMAVQMAEIVCEAVIRHFRELDVFEAQAREGRWQRRAPRRRADWPVGILGVGVLGERVARALSCFEFPVNGYSHSPKSIPGLTSFHGADGLEPFLQASRHLVCLLPLTPETRGLLCRRTLARLRPGGLLVNLARGAHLVDDDLLALLDEGHLDGALLDVFHEEPLPAEHPFWRHPQVRITPHVAAQTLRDESLQQIAGKLRAVHAGQTVRGVVRAERGY